MLFWFQAGKHIFDIFDRILFNQFSRIVTDSLLILIDSKLNKMIMIFNTDQGET